MTHSELSLAFGLSTMEIVIILVVALLLFGRRLPEIMRGMGSSVREFKKGMDEGAAAVQPPPSSPAPPAAAPPKAPSPAAPAGTVARSMEPPRNDPPAAS